MSTCEGRALKRRAPRGCDQKRNAYASEGLAQRKPAKPEASVPRTQERRSASQPFLPAAARGGSWASSSLRERANEGSVMLPRGRGEAENRACEGLGFAEVLKPRPGPADSGRFRRKQPKSAQKGCFWTKKGCFWPVLSCFWLDFGRFSSILKFSFPADFWFWSQKIDFQARKWILFPARN